MTPHHFLGKEFSQIKTTKSSRGFTLVEILVAVTIFVMVITIASSLFVSAIRGQRRNLAYQELLDQTSYVMEYMSRSIRMAKRDDECTGAGLNYAIDTIPALGECLYFKNYKGECQYFCLHPNKRLKVATSSPPGSPPPADFTDLTSSKLKVHPLEGVGAPWVALSGEGQGDNIQPLVTILLKIEGEEETEIQIQTSISQRNLDK